MEAHFHERLATPEAPAGFTISRHAKLPDGDFRITEYLWGDVTLWFVDADKFTADEREATFRWFAAQRYAGSK